MTIPRVEPRPGRLKKCTGRCGDWLSVDDFSRDRSRADGRRGECRLCRRDRKKALARGFRRYAPWGMRGSVAAKARANGLKPTTVRDRLTRGWPLSRALMEPVTP